MQAVLPTPVASCTVPSCLLSLFGRSDDRWALATLSVSVQGWPMRAEVPDAGRHGVVS